MIASDVAEGVADWPKKKQGRINYALAATLLASGVNVEDIPPRVGAKNWNVLRVGLAKRGVTASATRALPPSQIVVQAEAVKVATDTIEAIRIKAGKRLEMQLDSLAAQPVGELASKGQGEASVLKTIAETHRTLFGGSDQIQIVFGVGSLQGDGPQPVVVDAEIVPDVTDKQA